MDLQRKTSQGLELEHPIKFTYPILVRIILGIGGLAFLTAAVFTSPLVLEQGLEVWVPLVFLVFGVLDIVVWYFLSGQNVIDNHAVSFQRLGRKIRIPFKEVLRIEHRDASDRLVIHGLNDKIIVEKQLKDYLLFYSLLDRLCPIRDREAHLSFPFEIHTRRWVPLFSGVIILVGFGNMAYAFHYSYIPVGILGILGAIIGGAFLLVIPRRYIFDASGLTVISPIRKKIYKAETLFNLGLNRPFNTYSLTDYSLLVLNYENGKVMLRDLAVDFPLEALVKLLYKHYPRLLYNTENNQENAG